MDADDAGALGAEDLGAAVVGREVDDVGVEVAGCEVDDVGLVMAGVELDGVGLTIGSGGFHGFNGVDPVCETEPLVGALTDVDLPQVGQLDVAPFPPPHAESVRVTASTPRRTKVHAFSRHCIIAPASQVPEKTNIWTLAPSIDDVSMSQSNFGRFSPS